MKIKIEVDGFRCDKCSHEWIPKSRDIETKQCPKCKTLKWNDSEKKKKFKLIKNGPKELS